MTVATIQEADDAVGQGGARSSTTVSQTPLAPRVHDIAVLATPGRVVVFGLVAVGAAALVFKKSRISGAGILALLARPKPTVAG